MRGVVEPYLGYLWMRGVVEPYLGYLKMREGVVKLSVAGQTTMGNDSYLIVSGILGFVTRTEWTLNPGAISVKST